MKVLIISTNTQPASPSGPAYVAGAVRQAGHIVDVFERLFASELESDLAARLDEFAPDVVGISIRLVFDDKQDNGAPWGTRHTDLRPQVKEIVDIVRKHSRARIVLGGPGFNYYACEWLDYLDFDYGIRGEGEEVFPLFLETFAHGGDIGSVPGCVFRKKGGFHTLPPRKVEDLNNQALPAYDLFDLEQYARRQVTPAILTKRGCALNCTFCPYSKLEGKRYRLKSPERVLAEIRHTLQHTSSHRITFVENSFNFPQRHAESLCKAFIQEDLDFTWSTGDLKPIGVTDEFCRLLFDSGCNSLNLAIESASEAMLKRMKRGYTLRQVWESLEALNRSKIPFGVSILLGAPGETPDTIAETLAILEDYQIPNGVWFTIGVYLWTDYQEIVGEARQTGYLKDDRELFTGSVYLSPDLPGSYLKELVTSLREKPGYAVQVNKPSEEWTI